ncbi:hypothetical protein GPECTOR_23g84 [Gonium pectorale]|uniref:Uncharacterized protein n=1 Tax=Gonium pectorale TaxID=33097 RepID=A0A150GH72_GONPE|nr:hypothetical protein GPECTOR_23g84 [Gonium pectorale]|eukprot:KXZ49157.1 hypothetical protein GPECTOR_23g84 [Gonium pectorale]
MYIARSRSSIDKALSPEDLYRQFVAIRDAVLRKAAAASGCGVLRSHSREDEGEEAPDSVEVPRPGVVVSGAALTDEPERPATAAAAASGWAPAITSPGRIGNGYVGSGYVGGGGGIAGGAFDGGYQQSPRCRASDAASTASMHSPHRLSNATFADSPIDRPSAPATTTAYPPLGTVALSPRASPCGSQSAAVAPPISPRLPPPDLPQDAAGTGSPVIIDLQHFYRSPTPSTGGLTLPTDRQSQAASPFQGAVSYASDCVAYNALYTGAAPRTARSPPAPGDAPEAGREEGMPAEEEGAPTAAQGAGSGGDGGALGELAGCSIPGTDSLFSLHPSVPCGGTEPSWPHSQTLPELGAGARERCASGATCAAARMLVFQEDMASAVGDRQAAEVVETGGEVRLSRQGSGVVVHGGSHTLFGAAGVDGGHGSRGSSASGRGSRFSDYQCAVRSAAAGQVLVPLPPLDLPAAERGSGSVGAEYSAASASAKATPTHTAGVISGVLGRDGVYSSTAEHTPASPFSSYVPLPLPGLPPLSMQAVAGDGNPAAATALRPAVPLPTSPSMEAAAADAARKCLDKGVPFAVMTRERFAAVVAAAEAHDSPLALHLLTTTCAYYPGTGRHAASVGGAALDVGCCASEGSGSAASSPLAGSFSGAGLLGRKPATAAATAAVAAVRKLLDGGEALHVMSPGEYQRIVLAAQYGVRQLHDMLAAVPAAPPAAGEPGAPPRTPDLDVTSPRAMTAAAVAIGRLPPLLPAPRAGSMGRRGSHRRGTSIGSEGSFTATVVRCQSGSSTPVRAEPSASAPTIGGPAASQPQGPERLRALVQAAQHGNAARVAYLVSRGADVNATEGAGPQQHPPATPSAPVEAHAVPATGATATPLGVIAGRTALHYAAEAGSFSVVQLLLHFGAFVGVRDSMGGQLRGRRRRTAHDLARRKGHEAVAQLLKDAAERRRGAVRSCAAAAAAAAERDSSAGSSVGAARPALGLGLGFGSRASPRLLSRDIGGASGARSAASATTAAAAPAAGVKDGGSVAHGGPTVAAAAAPSAGGFEKHRDVCSGRSAGYESEGSATALAVPRSPLSRFSKEATAAAAVTAATVGTHPAARVPPAATVASAVAASEICADSSPALPVPAAGAAKAAAAAAAADGGSAGGAGAGASQEAAESDSRVAGGRGGRRRGLLACFVCGA